MTTIPKDEQIDAILTHTCSYLMVKYHGTDLLDPGKHLSVSRQDVEDYLRHRPAIARYYLDVQMRNIPVHDAYGIECDPPDRLVVYAVDHGRRSEEKRFRDIAEVIAFHAMLAYGMAHF